MNAEVPIANRICSYKQLKRNWEIHESKILNLKCSVDQSPPPTLSRKKPAVNSLRERQIQLENRVLLDKLLNVPRQSSTKPPPKDFTQGIRERYRQERNRVIDRQNQSMESRVKCSKTNYPLIKYLREREKTEKYLNIMSRFRSYHHNLWMRNSPGKYKAKEYTERQQRKFRETVFERCFNEKIYRIEGYLHCGNIEIIIRNKSDKEDKHDISMDIQQGIRVVDEYFGSSFRRMLDSIQFDRQLHQFYIKLP